jgi:hypothetical protein
MFACRNERAENRIVGKETVLCSKIFNRSFGNPDNESAD